jgi:hypothetical protein
MAVPNSPYLAFLEPPVCQRKGAVYLRRGRVQLTITSQLLEPTHTQLVPTRCPQNEPSGRFGGAAQDRRCDYVQMR